MAQHISLIISVVSEVKQGDRKWQFKKLKGCTKTSKAIHSCNCRRNVNRASSTSGIQSSTSAGWPRAARRSEYRKHSKCVVQPEHARRRCYSVYVYIIEHWVYRLDPHPLPGPPGHARRTAVIVKRVIDERNDKRRPVADIHPINTYEHSCSHNSINLPVDRPTDWLTDSWRRQPVDPSRLLAERRCSIIHRP